ncbi:hypothetical protein NOVOSPHI9U_40536 [Novosphingobium sp. 9U]|nr:hypothetical protein NOVOSPHI9U_40536 [Novosphingobium sp. 9U]
MQTCLYDLLSNTCVRSRRSLSCAGDYDEDPLILRFFLRLQADALSIRNNTYNTERKTVLRAVRTPRRANGSTRRKSAGRRRLFSASAAIACGVGGASISLAQRPSGAVPCLPIVPVPPPTAATWRAHAGSGVRRA